jgi:transposase
LIAQDASLLLKQKLIETTSTIAKVSAEKIALADERNVALAQRDAALQENEKLLLILSQYKRALFGRRSEKMDADRLQLLLSGNEASIVAGAANENAAADRAGNDTKAGAPDKPARPRPDRNRGMLPVHLPRVDVVIDVESKICPCCGGSLHKVGETVKEMFDVVPVQYRVKRMVRPRYGCGGCESAVVQAPALAQPIDGGMATEAVLAHVATMKYGYQVPIYRQAQMLASQGVDLDRRDIGTVDGPAGVVAQAAARRASGYGAVLSEALCRRDAASGARSRTRQDQDVPVTGRGVGRLLSAPSRPCHRAESYPCADRQRSPMAAAEASTCKRYAPSAQREKMSKYRAWFHERRRPPRA